MQINAWNAPNAYQKVLSALKICGKVENTRNGPVVAFPNVFQLTVHLPDERVLFHPDRNANPFFHLMEAIWMFGGENRVDFLLQFNKRYQQYADAGSNIVHGAYGHRWRNWFEIDQIMRVCDMLIDDPNTRRAVINMWDPTEDLDHHNDIPCNTQLMFRTHGDNLDMTVINRSNDVVWGMLGANIVHMTMLQELIAHATGLMLGKYHVVSNNAHAYLELYDFRALAGTSEIRHEYYGHGAASYPLLHQDDRLCEWLNDAEMFVKDPQRADWQCSWFHDVAFPMYNAHVALKHKNYGAASLLCDRIAASDWRVACQEYIERKS